MAHSSLVWLGKFAVLGPSKRTSPVLLLLTTASVSAWCLVPVSAGAGPQLAPHAPGLFKLPHVHMLRMVRALTPIFRHLPVPCTYSQRQGLRWIATTTLHLVVAETFQMLTCSPAGVRQQSATAMLWKQLNVLAQRGRSVNLPLPIRFVSPLALYLCFISSMLPHFYARSFLLLVLLLPSFASLLHLAFSRALCSPPPPCSVLQMAARQRFVCGEKRFEWRMETKEGTKRQ